MEGKSTKIWNIILTKVVLGDLIKWLFSCHKQENKHHHKHLLIQKPELAQQHDQSYQEGSSSRSTGNQQPSETGSAVLRDENLFNHKFPARQFGMKILKDWAEMVGIKVMFALFLKRVLFLVWMDWCIGGGKVWSANCQCSQELCVLNINLERINKKKAHKHLVLTNYMLVLI